MSSLVAILAATVVLSVAGCGGEEGGGTAAGEPAPETATASGGQPECRPVDAPPAKKNGGERRPAEPLDADKSYTVRVETNCGSFSFDLDLEASPKTSASIAALAERGFYDGTVFHRIVPAFVIQGGDPTGTGTGGPGYKTRDVPDRDTVYAKGTVAMAKAADEPAGTSGSQFFVVTDDAGGAQLTPEYAVVGRVKEGLDVVERIGLLGDARQQPTQVVLVEEMSVMVG